MEMMTNTAEFALAYTQAEEDSATNATVAWTMVALDHILGWNGRAFKGGRKAVIKMLREKHGYKRDASGDYIYNDKGQKQKRSAVYARLSLVDGVCEYLVKYGQQHVTALHDAAITLDPAKMQEAVNTLASTLRELAEGDTVDDLTFFLKHEKSKRAAKAEAEAEAEAEADAKAEAEADPGKALAESGEVRPMNFGDVMAWLLANRYELTDIQRASLGAFIEETESLKQRERMAEAEAEAEAA